MGAQHCECLKPRRFDVVKLVNFRLEKERRRRKRREGEREEGQGRC